MAVTKSNTAVKTLGTSLKSLAIKGGTIAGVSALVTVLYNLYKVSDEVANKAKELGETFNSIESDISSYKEKISGLRAVIDDESSAHEDVIAARKELLAVQDELIEKYGSEEDTIRTINEAIYGQSEALNKLTDSEWQEKLNEFKDETGWNSFSNFLNGYSDNLERMEKAMGYQSKWLNNLDIEKFDGLIEDLSRAGFEYDELYNNIKLDGTLNDIYDDLLEIQSIASANNAPESFLKLLTEEANKTKETLDEYDDFWDDYVLREKIFKDEDLKKTWEDANLEYQKYNEAIVSGDKSAADTAAKNYVNIINKAREDFGEIDPVFVDFMERMFPSMQAEFDKQTFTVDVLPKIKSIGHLEGKTRSDILEMMTTDGVQTGEGTLNQLLGLAIDAKLIGEYDTLTEKHKKICDFLEEANVLVVEVKENIKGTPSFSDIFALENAAGTITQLGDANKKVDELQTAYTGLKEAMASYNKTGYFTVDQVQDIISYGGEYLKYLVDENGNLKLNKEALDNVAIARLNEMRIKALSNLFDELDKITDETSAQAYLEAQLYETSAAYDQLAESRLKAWMLKIEDSDMTDATKNKIYKNFENQAAAINELFDNVNINSFWNGDIEGATKDLLDKELALLDAQQEAGTISFQQYIDNRKSILKKYYDDAKITAAEYYAGLKETYEKQQAIYDRILNAVTRRYDKEIKKIDETIESIQKQNEALEKQIEQYDLLLSAVSYVFDDERDALEEQQKAIDDRIDALQSENDELKKAIELEKAKDELLRARTQKTRYLYAGEGKGFIYTQDEDAIREAEQKVSDLEFQNTIDNLEKEKQAIQELIDKLNEAEEAWGKVADAFNRQKALSVAESIFGPNYKDIILNADPKVIQNFTNAYMSAQQQLEDNNKLIESWEEKKTVYEDMKSKWQEISSAYEDSVNAQLAAQLLGKNWEDELLQDRGKMMDGFKKSYTACLEEIARISEETAKREYEAALIAADARNKRGGGSGYTPTTPSNNSNDAGNGTYNVYDNNGNTVATGLTEEQAKAYINSTPDGSDRTFTLDRPTGYTFENDEEDPKKRGIQDKDRNFLKYHTGLDKGYVGGSKFRSLTDEERLSMLRKFARSDLKPGEVPAILQKGEAVMTPEQIRHVTDNMISASYGKFIPVPNIEHTKKDVNISQQITITLPNVTNESGYDRLVKELQSLPLMAYQSSFRR